MTEALVCTGLSKRYSLHTNPRDHLKQRLMGQLERFGISSAQPATHEIFWAVRDITLSIRKGQSVGIIGRNGSGKSTFLQLAAGVLTPSHGTIQTFGRVAALLELGTGFNPEFSGRENAIIGASLLGLDPDTILSTIPSIERFADIGPFFNLPLKRYSSGMQARLAFALVAHVQADLLIIDEALAVGDAAFSQKCMRFLREFRNHGTLCFVSHDAAAVLNLCESALWLDHGTLRAFDNARSVCREYAKTVAPTHSPSHSAPKRSPPPQRTPSADRCMTGRFSEMDKEAPWHGHMGAQIVHAQILAENGAEPHLFHAGQVIHLKVQARCQQQMSSPIIGFSWKDDLGQEVFGENTLAVHSDDEMLLPHDLFTARFQFLMPVLRSGTYYVTVAFAQGDQFNHVVHHWIDEAFTVQIETTRPLVGLMTIEHQVEHLAVTSALNATSDA